MNSIKLRAWHKESKEFVYFDFNKAINDQHIARNIVQLLANKHPDGKDLLTQSTGLTDNDKNDIYYGDVYRVYGYGTLVVYDIHDVVMLACAMGESDLGDKLGDIYNNPELAGDIDVIREVTISHPMLDDVVFKTINGKRIEDEQ